MVAEAEVAEPIQAFQSPLTHNGVFTVKSAATGEHRTFKVRTQPVDSQFAPGRRVVYLLVGADNTSDYQGFAFVDGGEVIPWRKHLGTVREKYCWMLQELQRHVAEGRVEVFVSCRCRVCNRTLTTPESVQSGIGPVCEGR